MKWKCESMRVIAGKHKSKALESLEGEILAQLWIKLRKVFLIVYMMFLV